MATLLALPSEIRQQILGYALHARREDPSGAPSRGVGDIRLLRKNGAPLLADISLRKGLPPPEAQVCRRLRADALDLWGRHASITIPFPQDAADEAFFNAFLDSCGSLVPYVRQWDIWSSVVFLKGLQRGVGDRKPRQRCFFYTPRARRSLAMAQYHKVLETKYFDVRKLEAMVQEWFEKLPESDQLERFSPVDIRELYYGPLRAMGVDTTNWRDACEPAIRFWALGSCRKDDPESED